MDYHTVVGNASVPVNGIDIADVGASGLRRNYSLSCGDWYDELSFCTADAATNDSPSMVNDTANLNLISRIRDGLFDYDDLNNPINCAVLPTITALPVMNLPALVSLVLLLILIGAMRVGPKRNSRTVQ